MSKTAPVAHDVIDLVRERWSPYAFDPARSVEPDKLLSLFEAARWAPSSSNEQPWAFIVGDRDRAPEAWQKVFDVLVPFNQGWAKNAPVLIIALDRLTVERNGNVNVNPTAMYDTGMAVGLLLIQAQALGLHVHQMGGYDRDRAREVFAIPDTFAPIAVIAVGYETHSGVLEDEKLRGRHDNPERLRKPIASFVFDGIEFGAPSPLVTPPA